MKTKLVVLLAFSLQSLALFGAAPLGTAFTYQGRLNDGGNPAGGSYDLKFTLFDDAGQGAIVAGPITNSAVSVSNGLFTVTLDFGGSSFTGDARWLGIGVRTNGSAADFTPLSPRQPLSPSPYTLYAPAAGTAASANGVLAGSINNAAIAAGAVDSSRIADGSIEARDLGAALASNTFWRLDGNASTTPGAHFLGTRDGQALEFKVNGLRALRLEDNGDGSSDGVDPNPDGAPNVIGGSPINFVAPGVVGATIGGGGTTNWSGSSLPQSVEADYGTIAGGGWNSIGLKSYFGAIGGGTANDIASNNVAGTIGGGWGNQAGTWASYSTIGGGLANAIGAQSTQGTIAGGERNHLGTNVDWGSIGGGSRNTIADLAGGGVIGGGRNNMIDTNSAYSVIGGGTNNTVAADSAFSTIAGGRFNAIGTNSDRSVIGGGGYNSIAQRSAAATIAGGSFNSIQTNSDFAFIGAGNFNIVATSSAGIAAGEQNTIQSNAWSSFIGAGKENTIESGGKFQFLGAGWRNTMKDGSSFSVLAGGTYNTNGGFGSMVLGGSDNLAEGENSLAAGYHAKANHNGAFVWSDDSSATAFASTTANEVSFRCVGGMRVQSDRGLALNASDAPIITRAFDPFASNAGADKAGLGRWGLFMEPAVLALGMPALSGRYVAITKFYTNGTRADLMSVNQAGTVTATAFNPTSDRNAKENFTPLDPRETLRKVVALPISKWNFKEDAQTPHAGPMAQDFHAAFGLGADERHIATVDADGVALAAIQGLNQKVEAGSQRSEDRIRKLAAENAELRARLDRMERLLAQNPGDAQDGRNGYPIRP